MIEIGSNDTTVSGLLMKQLTLVTSQLAAQPSCDVIICAVRSPLSYYSLLTTVTSRRLPSIREMSARALNLIISIFYRQIVWRL